MQNPDLRDLTFSGWLLAIVSIAAGVCACIPIGQWTYDGVDRGLLRGWPEVFVLLLSVPGIGVMVASFLVGRRLLERAGIHVRRSRTVEPRDPSGAQERDMP